MIDRATCFIHGQLNLSNMESQRTSTSSVPVCDTCWYPAGQSSHMGKPREMWVLPPKGVDTESNEQICPCLLPFCLAKAPQTFSSISALPVTCWVKQLCTATEITEKPLVLMTSQIKSHLAAPEHKQRCHAVGTQKPTEPESFRKCMKQSRKMRGNAWKEISLLFLSVLLVHSLWVITKLLTV